MNIDFIEFYSSHFEKTEDFFKNAFGWSYIEYGPDYRDIQGAGMGGGLERSETRAPLVVLKSDDLENDRDKIVKAGAELLKDIYDFPGGRRFEFLEPGGTMMAVWSESS